MGFGQAVDVAAGNVFIGEPSNVHQPGLVYIYNRSGMEWSKMTQLEASDGQIGDGFGSAITASESRVLVGAPQQNEGQGASYIFERGSDNSWSQAARIAISDTSAEGFGSSVAMHGDHAFIGSPDEQDDAGAVYVFQRDNSGSWMQKTKIANPDTAQGFSFGSALAFDGSRLLVAAPQQKGGAVHVYEADNSGSWTKEATLKSNRVDEDARFGSNVALHNNQVLVSAPRHAAGSGAVFVFKHNADAKKWMSSGRLVAYDSAPRYGFGSSMAFVGSNVWVGAPGAEDGKGAIYEFTRAESGSGWAGVTKMNGPDRKEGDQFAGTMAVGENVAVAGLTGADYGAGTAAIFSMDSNNGSWNVQSTVFSKGSVLEPITGKKVECSDGKISYFGCNNMDLHSFLPIDEIGGERGVRLNDIWGWTDPKTGKEYALVGRIDGTSFVDVTNPSNPVYVGNLPKPDSSNTSVWRDIKVYKNHAYIVADNAGTHGIQVVDLTKLRDFDGTPLQLETDAHYGNVHSVHNIVINESTGYAYAVGSSGGGQTCGGGLHMVNIQDPTNPTFAGCFADPSTGRSGTGYTHDAQCVTYHGPDEEYKGQEICIGANETALSIADVTDKENPKALSTASYPDYGYVHQGWLTENHRYFFSNDELDELTGNVEQTRTLVWDVSDLDDPQFVREFKFDNKSSDHNLYIKGDTMYQSNYVSGLQVVDISDPENPKKVGYFDTEPFGKDEPGFSGTWSNYPYFESGTIIMTSGREGLFILDKSTDTQEM
jgi:choice-of-anchor B domain-containing protein